MGLLLVFFWPAVFLGRVLAPADLIYQLDPVWRGYAPAGFTGPSNPLTSDVLYQFYPWMVFARDNVLRGIVPLWNPYVLGGTPFLANDQSAIFYPVNLLSYLLPVNAAPGFAAASRLFIAGILTYLYLRRIAVSHTGGLIGGVTFAFSGFLVVWAGHSMANVAVWLPGLLLFTERLRQKGHLADAAGLAAVIGIQFAGGYIEASFHILLIWAVYTLYRLPGLWRGRFLGQSVVSGVLGSALGAVQLLPFADLLTRTAILADRSQSAPGFALFDPGWWREGVTSITILIPNALGNPTLPNYWTPAVNFSEQTAYAGIVPLALAFLGVVACWRVRGTVRFWAITGLVALLIAWRLPGIDAINHIQPFNLVINGRLRLVFTFGVAALAGIGTDILIARLGDPAFRRRLNRSLILLGAALAAALMVVYGALITGRDQILAFGRRYLEQSILGQPTYIQNADYYLTGVERFYTSMLALYDPRSLLLYAPVLFAFGLVAMIALSRKAGLSFRVALVGLVFADLFVFGSSYNPAIEPASVFPENRIVQFLRDASEDDANRVTGMRLALMPNSSMLWGLADVRGYENTQLRRNQEFLNTLGHRLPFGSYQLLESDAGNYLDLMGVKYVAAEAGQALGPAMRPVFRDGDMAVYGNAGAMPRAYVVSSVRYLPASEALAYLRSADSNPRREVILDSEAPPSAGPFAQDANVAIVSAGRAKENPNEIEVVVEIDGEGYLVLTDVYDEGWNAYVDGRPAPVLRANHTFMAVALSAGQHRVRLVYQPVAFVIGAWLSAASLAAILLIVLANVAARVRYRFAANSTPLLY